jgi:hypothetical protein
MANLQGDDALTEGLQEVEPYSTVFKEDKNLLAIV